MVMVIVGPRLTSLTAKVWESVVVGEDRRQGLASIAAEYGVRRSSSGAL